ncbi:MAG: hypothetical protein LBO74_04740 [Candidatus Symbiothrix sp.]|jgi:hypothetical protein|nr:hypothetical protein [Candidatus Symbiothrix sp.]
MKRKYYTCLVLTTALLLNSCYEESKLLVKAEFQAIIRNENYTAPVEVSFENNSTGADFYQWTFEGGTPSTSTGKDPGVVVYDKAGEYTIKLEAWNNTERNFKEFTFKVDSTVRIGFEAEILINNFVPAEVKIINRTEGASAYQWIFDGGSPETFAGENPGIIRFNEAGEHKITLTVNNGRETFSTFRTIELAPAMQLDFDIEPSFNDFDYEAPFTAWLRNKSTNALSYEWSATGGTIVPQNETDAEITLETPGTYIIRLQGENGKESQTTEQSVTLKKNTNLYTLKDVKFGIKKAESTIGAFYSLPLRSIIKKEEMEKVNGADINLVFFGLDATFSRCYFTSPDEVISSGFAPIPGAVKTCFVNDLSETPLHFTNTDFEAMLDDSKLKELNIRSIANTTSWFTNVFVPRFVLFETEPGIKGIINVKGFISQGDNSYILTDIKVQKEKTK